jgi:hypothetical protein
MRSGQRDKGNAGLVLKTLALAALVGLVNKQQYCAWWRAGAAEWPRWFVHGDL